MDRRVAVVPHFGEVPVLVPLQVRDVVLAQQRIQSVEQIGPRIRIHQVEHLLVAPGLRHPTEAGTGDPVGVCADDIRVRVHHFRLHPEPELHTAGHHGVDERRQPAGP
jgi:hypothetical protein